MVDLPAVQRNHLLAALPAEDLARWLPSLEPVELPLGGVLSESGTTMTHVYFPTTAIVSLLYVMEDGASAEIAVVGHEGVVGISLFMGGEFTRSERGPTSAGLEKSSRCLCWWASLGAMRAYFEQSFAAAALTMRCWRFISSRPSSRAASR